MLIIGAAGRRGDDEPGNAADDECVLGILHQEFEKDDGCPQAARHTTIKTYASTLPPVRYVTASKRRKW